MIKKYMTDADAVQYTGKKSRAAINKMLNTVGATEIESVASGDIPYIIFNYSGETNYIYPYDYLVLFHEELIEVYDKHTFEAHFKEEKPERDDFIDHMIRRLGEDSDDLNFLRIENMYLKSKLYEAEFVVGRMLDED